MINSLLVKDSLSLKEMLDLPHDKKSLNKSEEKNSDSFTFMLDSLLKKENEEIKFDNSSEKLDFESSEKELNPFVQEKEDNKIVNLEEKNDDLKKIDKLDKKQIVKKEKQEIEKEDALSIFMANKDNINKVAPNTAKKLDEILSKFNSNKTTKEVANFLILDELKKSPKGIEIFISATKDKKRVINNKNIENKNKLFIQKNKDNIKVESFVKGKIEEAKTESKTFLKDEKKAEKNDFSLVDKKENLKSKKENNKIAIEPEKNFSQKNEIINIDLTTKKIEVYLKDKGVEINKLLDSNKDFLFENIAKNTKIAIMNGQTSFSTMIRPESLGRVDFKFLIKDGKVSGKLIVQNSEAADFFKSNVLELKAVLQKANVELENLDIIMAGNRFADNLSDNKDNNNNRAEIDFVKVKNTKSVANVFENTMEIGSVTYQKIFDTNINLLI